MQIISNSHLDSNTNSLTVLWSCTEICKGLAATSVITAKLIFSPNFSPPSAEYVSVNQVNIGSDNGLSPIRHQATI